MQWSSQPWGMHSAEASCGTPELRKGVKNCYANQHEFRRADTSLSNKGTQILGQICNAISAALQQNRVALFTGSADKQQPDTREGQKDRKMRFVRNA